MIGNLESLRGIFAILIFCHHFLTEDGSLSPWGGDCGVSFFLMLSGFVMCEAESHHVEPIGYGRYMLKRVARIWPLHIFCLAASIVLFGWAGGVGAWTQLISNFLLIQSWIPDSSFYFSGNSVGWYLSDLLFFYLIFPFLYRLLICKRILFVVCLLMSVAATLTMDIVIPQMSEKAVAWIYIFTVTRLADFLSGMFVWSQFSRMNSKYIYEIMQFSSLKATLIELLCLMPLVAAVILWRPSSNYGLSLLWWLPFFILLPAFSLLDKGRGMVTAILHRPFMILFGRYSFTFYMLHLLVIRVFARIDRVGEMELLLRFPLIFLSVVLLSLIVANCVERPIGRLILRSVQNK